MALECSTKGLSPIVYDIECCANVGIKIVKIVNIILTYIIYLGVICIVKVGLGAYPLILVVLSTEIEHTKH